VTTGAVQSANAGGADAFIAELGPSGSQLLASTYLGGMLPDTSGGGPITIPPRVDDEDLGVGIGTDAAGDVFIGGETNSIDFPTVSGAFQPVIHGNYDGFVAQLSPGLTALTHSSFIGGSAYDFASNITLDAFGDVYLAGETQSSMLFPTTTGAFQ